MPKTGTFHNETVTLVKHIMPVRMSHRYRLSCPALCRWAIADGCLQNSRGETHDISTQGVFVLADLCPPIGTQIEIMVLLSNSDGTGVGMQLQGEGTVLRLGQRNPTSTSGFAISVNFRLTRPTMPPREEEELGYIQMLNKPLTTQ